MAETSDRVCEIVSTIFNVPRNEVNADSSSKTVENWDSMGHLMLILELEQEFDKQFAPEDVEKMYDVATIVKVLGT